MTGSSNQLDNGLFGSKSEHLGSVPGPHEGSSVDIKLVLMLGWQAMIDRTRSTGSV